MLDFMGKEELAGNLFRLAMTEARLKSEAARGQSESEYIAENVGQSVRKVMIEQTGQRPESLPLVDDLMLVKKGLKSASKELLPGRHSSTAKITAGGGNRSRTIQNPCQWVFPRLSRMQCRQ